MSKKIKTLIIAGVAAIVIIGGALYYFLTKDEFHKTDSGLMYKFYTENDDSAKAKEGDVILLHLVYKINDSTLFDTRTINNGEPSPTILSKPAYNGDLAEGYAMMHVGDSATFKVNADTFFFKITGRPDLPPGVKPGSDLCIDVKLYKVQSKKEYEQEQATLFEKLKAKEVVSITNYMKKNNLTATPTASGLYYIETKKGSGKKVEAGKTVSVHYTGYFMSGSKFDSSLDRGKPFDFPVGQGQVIPGWDEGVAMMSVGTKAKLIVPWWIAYGPNGYGEAIPAFASLVFDVEVVDVK